MQRGRVVTALRAVEVRALGAADWIRADYPSAQIVTLENRGRDILPFVILINSGVLFHYDLVCKVHSKRSMHIDSGDTWRRELVGGVLSDPNRVAGILADFDTDRRVFQNGERPARRPCRKPPPGLCQHPLSP